jgi:tetratricopeptide (TPR) repeat protein
MEPVAVSAVGFPWAQERPDRGRDSEQLFGFIAPATTVKAGLCAVTVKSSAPADRMGGSPWAGMSGAALFAGPFLVGVVVVDPARFGADRVVAVPIAPLLADAELAGLLDVSADGVAGMGPRLRLAITAETSVALAPPYRAATPRLGREPARLLLPEYGIVPFAGRESDLELLEAWCLNGGPPALRVIIGAGGSGKSRLAAEICVRMVGKGWQAGFADPMAPGGQAQLEFDLPTLLIVEDADLNVTLLADLVRVVGYWPSGAPPVRLLLLARHTTGWWDTLNRRTDRLVAELADPPLTLSDGGLTPSDRTQHHTRAISAFHAHVPDAVAPVGQPPPLLADPAFANPLLVHMHALLTVFGAQIPIPGTDVRNQVLDGILDRERDRWAVAFPPGVLTGGARMRHQAVSAATLLAPPTETATAQIMTAIAELAPDSAAGARAAVATWLRELYPGSDPPWVAPLRPDLLAEQLLASCPQLSDIVLAQYANIGTSGQLEQLLTELTRADTRPPVREALDQLLDAHLADVLTAALKTPEGQLPSLLDLALIHSPQPAVAAKLVHRLPERSIGLAALAATVTSQAVDHQRHLAAARPDKFTPTLAMSLASLGRRLADRGSFEEALDAAEEAVGLYRQLARNNRAVRPDLARALTSLGKRQAELGRYHEALAATEESVALYRRLARRGRALRPDLADALTSLGIRLAQLGRWGEALAAAKESVALYRSLAKDNPALSADLAEALNSLAERMGQQGRYLDALPIARESVGLYRLLAADNAAFQPDLAWALTSLGIRFDMLDHLEEARAAAGESVALYRSLAPDHPVLWPDLARALNSLGIYLAKMSRYQEALAAAEESADLFRPLARQNPAHQAFFGTSLINLTNHLESLANYQKALASAEECVGMWRSLARKDPDYTMTYHRELARLHRLRDQHG